MKNHDVDKSHYKPAALKDLAEKYRENDNTDWIHTIYSDELYRWPSGKAPWSTEQGTVGPNNQKKSTIILFWVFKVPKDFNFVF